MWVGALLWLGEIKQIAVINFIRRVFGTYWSTGQTSLPRARVAPCRAFMAKSTDYLQVLKWFSELKGTRWCDSLRKRRWRIMSFYRLEIKQRSASGRSWPLSLDWARVCPAARGNLASPVRMMQAQASKQTSLLFVAPHLPDTRLRVVLLFWAAAAGPQWRPRAWSPCLLLLYTDQCKIWSVAFKLDCGCF